MEYIVTSDSFTKISETAGTLQNLDKENEIEMSENPVFDSGLRVKTGEKLNFSNTDIYLRCIKDGGTAIVHVVPFSVDAKGGDVSSVDTTALKSVALVGNALNFYTSSDTAQAAAYSIDIPAEQFIDQAATSFVPNFYFSAILYPDAVNPNLNGKPVFVLGVKTKSNDGLSNTVKYSFIDVSKLVDTYVASDTSVTVSDYKFKVNISTDEKNALKLKANGLYADGVTDTATSSALGLTKLYGTTGANTDGTLTQAAITTALAAKLDSDATAAKAFKDSAGNVITDTYATKTALSNGLNSKLDSDAKAVSATTADKLSTARSLKVSLSSTSAPTFDGSANVTIGVGGILPTTYGGTGNANGTVSGAAQLNTSRNFITNLNSTSAGSFNGTASVSAGVTGTLPVANGGTGQTNLDNVIVGKAVKDSSGNVITDTYVTKSELSHKLGAVRYGYRIKKDEADPDLRVEYLYDAAGMRPAHMVFDTDISTAGTDSDTSYFDYGDWQSVWFVRDNKPCMLNPDGSVAYYLNPNDYTKKIDGTSSQVADTDTAANAMAQIPLCWVKRYEDDDYIYEIVSNIQYDEDYKAYAHTDSAGQIKDYFYNAIYRYSGSSSQIRSLSGQPHIKLSFVQSFAAASANGSGWTLPSWSQYQLIRTLLFLLSKSTHILASFGKVNSAWSVGGSEAFGNLAPIGEGNTRGQFFGFSHTQHKFQRKIFHSETYNGEIYLVGLFNNRSVCKLKMTPPYATAPDYSYITYGTLPYAGEGFISAATVNDFGLFPTAYQGSDSTFFCCAINWSNSASVDNAISRPCFSFVTAHQPTSVVRVAMGSALSYV